MKILMVCLGNICRSPLAEGILTQKAKEQRLNWDIASAGTGHWHVGQQPDPRSIKVAQAHGLDISHQRAQQVKATHLEDYDLIFAMDTQNYQDLLKLGPKAYHHKIKLILNEVFPDKNKSVPDPYWDDNGFEAVYQLLDQACQHIIDRYQS